MRLFEIVRPKKPRKAIQPIQPDGAAQQKRKDDANSKLQDVRAKAAIDIGAATRKINDI